MRVKVKLLAATIPLLLAGCNAPAPEETTAIVPQVTTLNVELKNAELTERFVGKTEAIDKVDILPKVAGYIISRNFKEGEVVNKGDLLFQIDPVPYQIEVERLDAQLADITAQYNIADKKYQKAKTLVSKDALSKLELDQIKAERDAIAGKVAAAKADLKRAQLELDYTQIKAPFTGLIGASTVSVGSLVGPDSTPLTRLNSTDGIYVSIQVDEKEYLNDLQKKAMSGHEIAEPAVHLELANGAEYNQEGEVNFIDNQVDKANGSIQFRFKFPNPNALLVPGQFVTVVTSETQVEPAVVIPQQVVQEDQRGRYVLTVNGEQVVEAKYLTLGQRIAGDWVVKSGLEKGDRVIVKGLQQARPGSVVDVVDAG
ncbi:efflux RND transporter periplasmic adaptor subunit [Vibrio sp.]|uniref:efflux RND transporter periplasmic adaptor subunit n=1 Tax=Vibrio sp. TaxID=678 RepID=UPI003D0C7AC8